MDKSMSMQDRGWVKEVPTVEHSSLAVVLDGKLRRVHLHTTMDAFTRCIIGFVVTVGEDLGGSR
jgi:hypothetical protein